MPGIEKPPKFEAPLEEEKKEKLTPIEIKKDKVVVMGVEIPRNPEPGPRTPKVEKFRNFVDDEFSLELLQKIAKGVSLGVPTLLEGEQGIGKSYTIEYLASLANQEVYRMSLNGQVDTTDLIGKWVPRSKSLADLIWSKIKKGDLTPESKAILERKKKIEAGEEEIEIPAKSGLLTKEEMMQIALNEGIEVSESEWLWQDGEIPRQIENGAWTVLDEINTCEPQILVRLNALLEEGGELVIYENTDRIPKPKDPNKRSFLFATVNPPGGRFRGRVPFSAEWISRWNYQNVGKLPLGVAVFRAKKRNGCKVEVNIERIKEKFVFAEPIEEELTLVDVFGENWVSDFCEKYITAFYKIQEMIEKGEIASRQEQKFDYDQRDWIRFEKYIRTFYEPGKMKKTIEDAIEYIILGKLKYEQDREKVKDVILELIKVSEPKERIPRERKKQERYLKNLKTEILKEGIPEHHKKIMFEK